MPQRIGLFGGSFDPIHNGHEYLAAYLVDYLKLTKLIFIPAFSSVMQKQLQASAEHRFNMCQLIAESYENIDVSDFEIQQAKAVYTIDTVKHFRQVYPGAQLFLIIGADQAIDFDKWQAADEILKNVCVVIYPRPGYELLKPLTNNQQSLEFNNNFTNGTIHYMEKAKTNNISSTLIRSSLQNTTQNLNPLVKDYIQIHKLYKEKPYE